MVGKRAAFFPNDDDGGGGMREEWKQRSNRKANKSKGYGSTDVEQGNDEDAKRREKIKETLVANINKDELEKFRKSEDELEQIEKKGLREYYERLNKRIDDWMEVDVIVKAVADDVLESMNPDPDGDGLLESTGGIQDVGDEVHKLLPKDEQERREKANNRASMAINVNVVANIFLLVGKAFAVLSSGSLSLVASLVDSALDLLCTIIIWSTNKIVQWRLESLDKMFPVGRRRLKSLGTLVFGVIMVISFFQVLHESIEKLAPLHGKAEALPLIAVGVMLATVVVKGILGVGCVYFAGAAPQVQALAQDCKTDVIFNTLSLIFPYIGAKFGIWWLDPAGAVMLSLFIIYDWSMTCMENVVRLSGVGAEHDEEQKLVYLAYRFAPVVSGFKSITAYHQGDGLWVEYDILMEGNGTSLAESHDVSETLQYCAESLPNVERAFVTVDYDSRGPTGHAK